MRIRLTLVLSTLLLAAVVRPVRAQSVSPADLQTAALSAADLPGGFTQFSEQQTDIPPVIDLLYLRGFVNTGSTEMLVVELVVPAADLPAGSLSPSAAGDQFLRSAASSFASTSGADVQNFTANGPLGIGSDDDSGQWDATITATGVTLRIYADFFLQGNLLAAVIYGGSISSANVSQLVNYARLQQQKIVSANLGGGQ